MEFDLSAQPEIVQQAAGYALQAWELVKDWFFSPAAWSQFALLVVAWLLAVLVTRRLKPVLTRILTPEPGSDTLVSKARSFCRQFLPLLLPLLAFGFTAIGESVVRSVFESGAVIALGKRIFLFIAVRAFVRDIITDPFLKTLGRFVFVQSQLFTRLACSMRSRRG